MRNKVAKSAKVTAGTPSPNGLRVSLFDAARIKGSPMKGWERQPDGSVYRLLEGAGIGPKEVQAQRVKYDNAIGALRKMGAEATVRGGLDDERDRDPSLNVKLKVSETQAAMRAEHGRIADRYGFRLFYGEPTDGAERNYTVAPKKADLDTRRVGEVFEAVSKVVKCIVSGTRESELIWQSLREGKSDIPLTMEGAGAVVEVPTTDRTISMTYYSLALSSGFSLTLTSDSKGKRYRIIAPSTDEGTLKALDDVVSRIEQEMSTRTREIARMVADLGSSACQYDTPATVTTSFVKRTERMAALGIMALGQKNRE